MFVFVLIWLVLANLSVAFGQKLRDGDDYTFLNPTSIFMLLLSFFWPLFGTFSLPSSPLKYVLSALPPWRAVFISPAKAEFHRRQTPG